MVKKLLKHEFMALSRLLVPMYIILLGLAVISRIIYIFESDSIAYNIIAGSTAVVLYIGSLVALIYTGVSCIIRFYKNLFTKEGYLTFTLPVSVNAHLGTKLFSSVVAVYASCAVVFGAVCIATSGELLTELIKAAGYIFDKASNALGANLPLYFIEFALMFLISTCSGILLFYACMCVGQLAKRSRVLLALGVYFGYYYVTQAIATVGVILMTVFEENPAFVKIIEWIEKNPQLTIHLGSIGIIVYYAVLCVVYYLIAHAIMKKKLNLE